MKNDFFRKIQQMSTIDEIPIQKFKFIKVVYIDTVISNNQNKVFVASWIKTINVPNSLEDIVEAHYSNLFEVFRTRKLPATEKTIIFDFKKSDLFKKKLLLDLMDYQI